MVAGPCKVARTAQDCQEEEKIAVVRPIVPKGLIIIGKAKGFLGKANERVGLQLKERAISINSDNRKETQSERRDPWIHEVLLKGFLGKANERVGLQLKERTTSINSDNRKDTQSERRDPWRGITM